MMSPWMPLLLIVAMAANPDTDKVTFPQWDFPSYTFNTYSGFIDIAAGARSLHYVFVESMSNPATDPVVLWLNGGPGCSSLLGLTTEIGPYVIKDGTNEWIENPYPWNKKVNLLFLESPAGVGFSGLKGDYTYTDVNTGNDNAEAIRNWFTAFTAYQGRPFWISGESYAGMYIPYTAKAVLEGNKDAKNIKVELQGVMIGNGVLVMDDGFREMAMIKYFNRRNFVDLVSQNTLYNQCSFAPTSVSCQYATINFYFDCLTSNINPYNVYGYCYEDTTPEELKVDHGVRFPYTSWMAWNKVGQQGAPCANFGPLHVYFNDPVVQKALHTDGTGIKWAACNMDINKNYQRDKSGSYWILPQLYEAGLKVLIFSGDQDAAVSVVETEESLLKISGLTETKAWRAYGNSDDTLAGWITEYNYLTFLVVRGAGHMVPSDQRQNGYEMFQGFIDGTINSRVETQ